MAASAKPKPTGLFLKLKQDHLLTVVLFLRVDEYAALSQTSRYGSELLRDKDGLSSLYFNEVAYGLLQREMHPMPIELSRGLSTALLRDLMARMKDGKVHALLQDVVAYSSVDRAEERPSNVLERSRCYSEFVQLRAQVGHLVQYSDEQLGQYVQGQLCGCSFQRPCYWSCRPSATPNSPQYLAFRLGPSISLVFGFQLTPYCAWFQPTSPVYAPAEVELQFLLPEEPRATPLPLTQEELTNSSRIYYRSPVFPVENAFKEKYFMLPQPALCLHGTARLVMTGMVQRQTLEDFDVDHANDFYICLSHFQLLGSPLPHYGVERLGGASVGRVIIHPPAPAPAPASVPAPLPAPTPPSPARELPYPEGSNVRTHYSRLYNSLHK